MTKLQTISAVIIVAIIALGVLFFEFHKGETIAPQNSVATSTAATTTSAHTVSGVTGTGDFTVTMSGGGLPPEPDFKAAINFSNAISGDVRTQLQSEANILIGRIAKNPTDLRSWVDLGTLHKMGGDYKNAEVYWTYVTKAAPTNALAFNNLGDLYMNFLKEYAKAESNWLTAIKLNPADPSAFVNLYTLYSTTSYKSSSYTPESILQKGIASNPSSIDLEVLLARYYKSVGRTADAKAAYNAAVKIAQANGNQTAVQQIQQEEASL